MDIRVREKASNTLQSRTALVSSSPGPSHTVGSQRTLRCEGVQGCSKDVRFTCMLPEPHPQPRQPSPAQPSTAHGPLSLGLQVRPLRVGGLPRQVGRPHKDKMDPSSPLRQGVPNQWTKVRQDSKRLKGLNVLFCF